MLSVFDEKLLLPFPLVGFAVGSGREYGPLLIELGNKEVLQLPDTQGCYAGCAVLSRAVEQQGLAAH